MKKLLTIMFVLGLAACGAPETTISEEIRVEPGPELRSPTQKQIIGYKIRIKSKSVSQGALFSLENWNQGAFDNTLMSINAAGGPGVTPNPLASLGPNIDGPFADGSYEVRFKQPVSDKKHIEELRKVLDLNVSSASMSAMSSSSGAPVRPAGDLDVELEEVVMMFPQQVTYGVRAPLDHTAWHLGDELGGVNVTGAWAKTKGALATISVLDTGVTDHRLLDTVSEADFISNPQSGRDENGFDLDANDEGSFREVLEFDHCQTREMSSFHGTHVAGIAAARETPGLPFSGVAPESNLMAVRVLAACSGSSSEISDGMLWSAGLKSRVVEANNNLPSVSADIINMSLGGTSDCLYKDTLTRIEKESTAIVIVAAANNNFDSEWSTPGNCVSNILINVGAVGRDGFKATYSNFGEEVTVSAGGGSIGSRNEYYQGPERPSMDDLIISTDDISLTSPKEEVLFFKQGTSMAAPVVSGVAALAISRIRKEKGSYEKADRDAVIAALKSGVKKFPTTRPPYLKSHIVQCTTSICGSGIVSAPLVLDEIDKYLLRTGHLSAATSSSTE